VLLFVRGNCCVLIFCSWNWLHVGFSVRETHFVNETYRVLFFARGACCVLIFVDETYYISIFLLMKLAHWIFLLVKLVSSMHLLRADFFSWNLLHVKFSLRKTFRLIFLLVKLILFTVMKIICFVRRNVNVQVSRREKPTRNKFYEQNSARKKIHEEKFNTQHVSWT